MIDEWCSENKMSPNFSEMQSEVKQRLEFSSVGQIKGEVSQTKMYGLDE